MMNIQNVNPKKIMQELLSAGIEWEKAIIVNDDEVSVIFKDNTDMRLVGKIIHEHNKTPIPETPTQAEQLAFLGMQLSMQKLENMQSEATKDEIINGLGAQVTKMKFEIMQLKGGGA